MTYKNIESLHQFNVYDPKNTTTNSSYKPQPIFYLINKILLKIVAGYRNKQQRVDLFMKPLSRGIPRVIRDHDPTGHTLNSALNVEVLMLVISNKREDLTISAIFRTIVSYFLESFARSRSLAYQLKTSFSIDRVLDKVR